MTTVGDYHVFQAGDVTLQSGVVFRSMPLAYKTYGTLSARKDNVIVYPTSFGAQHTDTEWLVQRGGALDPDRYFIVIPNLFGNGLSSSPSNSRDTLGAEPFPAISYHDAVAAQRRHDNEDEIGRLTNAKSAELRPIPSIHRHRAGNPVNNAADRAFINAEISAFLQT